MELKYIMIKTLYGASLVRLIPVLFFEPVTHAAMWEQMRESKDFEHTRIRLHSAGFVTLSPGLHRMLQAECHGISESLRSEGLACAPHPDDASIISSYNYLHGIIS